MLPPTTTARNRSCGSFFFNWSNINMVSGSTAPDLAVRTETCFARTAVRERAVEQAKKLEQHRRGDGSADAHHDPLPKGSPADQWCLAHGQQQQDRSHRDECAR